MQSQNSLSDLELMKLCAEAAEVWKDAHLRYPTMTLDPTFCGAEIRGGAVFLVPNNPMRQDPQIYDPLHDDAQAMALVKKFRLHVAPDTLYDVEPLERGKTYSSIEPYGTLTNLREIWQVTTATERKIEPKPQLPLPTSIWTEHRGSGPDLNRAIVECVAKMQQEKK